MRLAAVCTRREGHTHTHTHTIPRGGRQGHLGRSAPSHLRAEPIFRLISANLSLSPPVTAAMSLCSLPSPLSPSSLSLLLFPVSFPLRLSPLLPRLEERSLSPRRRVVDCGTIPWGGEGGRQQGRKTRGLGEEGRGAGGGRGGCRGSGRDRRERRKGSPFFLQSIIFTPSPSLFFLLSLSLPWGWLLPPASPFLPLPPPHTSLSPSFSPSHTLALSSHGALAHRLAPPRSSSPARPRRGVARLGSHTHSSALAFARPERPG